MLGGEPWSADRRSRAGDSDPAPVETDLHLETEMHHPQLPEAGVRRPATDERPPRSPRSSLLGLSLLGLSLLGPTLPATALAGDQEEAAAMARQAQAAYQANHVREACSLYEQAYQLSQDPKYAFNIARLRDTLGEWEAAAPLYDAWIESGPPEDQLRSLRDKLSRDGADAAKTGDQDLAIRRLTLARSLGLLPDAEITRRLAVLLESRGRLGEALSHYRMALTEGHLQKDVIQATVDRLQEQLSASSIVVPQAQRGDTFLVDGREARLDDDNAFHLSPGSHVLIMKRPGFEPASVTVELSPGGKLSVEFNLAATGEEGGGARVSQAGPSGAGASSWLPSTITWIGLGAGVVALAGGGVFAGLASGANDEKNTCRQDLDCFLSGQAHEYQDDVETYDTATIVSLAAGGVLLLGAGAYWYFVDTQPTKTKAPVKATSSGLSSFFATAKPWPLLGTDGAGLALVGRF